MRKFLAMLTFTMTAQAEPFLIDDFTSVEGSSIGGRWSWSSDQVMGGVSTGRAFLTNVNGRSAAQLEGQVSTANNGGFIQIRLVFPRRFDASDYQGVELEVIGNGALYHVHLRDRSAWRPWHVYKAGYETDGSLQTIQLPFEEFLPYNSRIKNNLDVSKLNSLGLVAGYDDFEAELQIFSVRFY